MKIKNITFIGLGVMGYPMAGHLSKNNYNVTVYNRTNSKAKKWIDEYHGKIVLSPSEGAANADLVITCVGNDKDLREVLEGPNGVLKSIKSETIIIDHTTASANIAKYFLAYTGHAKRDNVIKDADFICKDFYEVINFLNNKYTNLF